VWQAANKLAVKVRGHEMNQKLANQVCPMRKCQLSAFFHRHPIRLNRPIWQNQKASKVQDGSFGTLLFVVLAICFFLSPARAEMLVFPQNLEFLDASQTQIKLSFQLVGGCGFKVVTPEITPCNESDLERYDLTEDQVRAIRATEQKYWMLFSLDSSDPCKRNQIPHSETFHLNSLLSSVSGIEGEVLLVIPNSNNKVWLKWIAP
jgi:hypothetical protein